MAHLPYFKQETLYTCGAAASRMVLSKHGVKLSEKAISKFLGVTPRKGTTLVMIKRLFDRYDFDARYHYKIRDKKSAFARLGDYLRDGFVVIALVDRFVYDRKTPRIDVKTTWENKRHSFHFVTIHGVDGRFVHFNDPHEAIGRSKLPIRLFLKSWTKYFLALKKRKAHS